MAKTKDLFGKALLDHYHGSDKIFYFIDQNGYKAEHSLKRYFRDYIELTDLEKEMILLSRGNILDVGCGPGVYIPYLAKHGTVLGIDSSSYAIDIALKKGLKNCKVANIFTFTSEQKFDTILLAENNLGLAQSLSEAKKLLQKLSSLLTDDGQILTDCWVIPGHDYYVAELTPSYGDEIGDPILWITFSDEKFLSKFCADIGLEMVVIDTNENSYLAKITKKVQKS